MLNKSEVNTFKSNERKQLIDEGVKLAKKVDLLRETSAKEEANLSKFRIESLKTLKEEIEVLIAKKDSLINEIENLQTEKNRLKKIITNLKEI